MIMGTLLRKMEQIEEKVDEAYKISDEIREALPSDADIEKLNESLLNAKEAVNNLVVDKLTDIERGLK